MLALALVACAHDAAPSSSTVAPPFRQLTIETPDAVRGAGSSQGLARALLEVGRDAGVELRGDGRLAQLAARFAERDPRSPAELIAAAQSFELADAALAWQRVHADAADLLPAALRVELPAAVQRSHATHFGVYVLPAGNAALVVLSRRPFVLEAVPAHLAANGVLHVRGRRAADVQGGRLVWSDPFGQQRAFALSSDLELDVRLPARANGRHRVELREQGDDGERTVLAFDVDVGEVAEAASTVGGAGDVERAQLEAVGREVFAQLAAFRGERGLIAFDADASLAQRARERCASAAAPSPASADPSSPPAASDAASVDEPAFANPLHSATAHGPDATVLYSALAADAALHDRLLDAARTRLGLAVCNGPAGLQAVALFAAPPHANESTELASGHVLLAINAHRRTRGVAPLRPDAALTEVAQRAATAMLERPDPNQSAIMERANAELEHYALRYRRVAAVAVVVHDASEAATLEPALDEGTSVVGIACAELRASETGVPNIAVILALGWER